MNILIIDDSKEDRELVRTYILKLSNGDSEMKVDESNCMKDALSKLEIYNYDVIILDLVLPESDGIETIKSVKEKLSSISKNTPIIILTGFEDYELGRKAFTLGIKDFLIKGEMHEKDLSRALNMATYNRKPTVRI